ncbi:putative NUC153 domain-containing protein [Seiridium cardinale]|uniref:NUC153 domain-containing protein n=1 Tax=Seiridium cardinale TaxID=138064 RepID=A0ABR2XSI9_9PEZI
MAKKTSQKPSAPSGDSRFANFQTDPRFRLPSKKSTKTKIDKRFSQVLKDDEFTKSAKVDRYGRKLKSDNKAKALKNLYQEESDEEQASDGVDDDEAVQLELQKADTKIDPARGGGFSSSESDSEDDSEEDDEDQEEEDTAVVKPGSMQRLRDEQAGVEVGDVTKRFAIVNLDWDYIKSSDLMALMSSFVPKGGRIEKVSIYPSEFGKERMQREELEGPPKEIFKKKAGDSDESSVDSEDESEGEDDDENIKNDLLQEGDDQDFDSDALRTYQLDRLRYYYAVVICSDEATAEIIYKAVDGTEYQSSSNFMDLRFIPDEVTFDDEPRDECDSIPSDYRPTEFVTDALQHSKVKLTWDMHPDDAARKENMKRAFSGSRTEIEENDMKAYLASSDSEADDDEQVEAAAEGEPKLSKKEIARQRMREALGLGPETAPRKSKSEPVGEMEMTFTLDDEDGAAKKQASPDREETTVEKYMRKEREKKARKRERALSKREGAADTAEPEEQEVQQEGDLGFDDPFFTTEEPAAASKSTQRKEERLKKRQLKEAEAQRTAEEKAHLEKVMGKDSKKGSVGHFNMAEISRAEKQKLKKGKSKKKQKEVEDQGGLQDDFSVDVGDNRFKAVFDSHEYAIDPSNPKFTTTPGMKQLLDRKKRSHGEEGSTSRDNKKMRRR